MFNKKHQQLLSKYKQLQTPTKSELKVKEVLDTLGVKYKQQKGFLADCKTFYIVDFYLPKPNKIVLEVDGEYHKNRVAYDQVRDLYFTKTRGFKVLRVTNEEVNKDIEGVQQKIQSLLKDETRVTFT